MSKKDTATEDVVMETAESKVSTAVKAIPKAEVKKTVQKESVYTAEELANNAAAVCGRKKECVTAALRAAGVTEATVTEAKVIVETFLKKEVK